MADNDAPKGSQEKRQPEAAGGAAPEEDAPGIFEYAERLQGDFGEDDAPVEHGEPWVRFVVAERRYALPVDRVQEVLRVGTITRVPHSPEAIGGVTNMRGRVLPVVDLRRRLGFEARPARTSSRILVSLSAHGSVGLLVDAVEQMVAVVPSARRAPPPELREEDQGAAVAVIEAGDEPVLLLDLERLLEPIAKAASG